MLYVGIAKAAEIAPDDTLARGENSKFLAFPFLLRSPETSWGFGAASAFFFKAKKDDRNIRTSDVNLVALYTLKKQLVIVIGSTIYFPGEKQIFRWQNSYSYYPDKFWGIGNSTPESSKESYSIKQFYFNPQFLLRTYKKFYIGITSEYQNVTDFKFIPNGVFEQQSVPGRFGGATSGVGALFTLDSRNNAYSPSSGGFVEFNATRFDKKFGSDFDFTSYSLELKRFFELSPKRVLALQIFGKVNAGDVPIRNLALLGGSEMMRGFYKGRYADKNMFTSQAEVRQFLFWRLGVVGFASAGQVSEGFHDIRWDRLHFAYGAGVRLMVQKKEKLNLRIDYGRGEGNDGVYVILKEAF
jgi:hypothetical protein